MRSRIEEPGCGRCAGRVARRRFGLLVLATLLVFAETASFAAPAALSRRRVPRRAEASREAAGEVQRSQLVQAWGVVGVACYLSYGVKKVVPIVRQGVSAITSPFQWLLLASTLAFFAYVEGYKGFQLGFCPRVVSRAWAVSAKVGPIWHKILAPAFCIGYFHGTRKRVISSWAVTSVIFCVVVGVRRMANPYRAIIDAGVIVGLLWGTVSVLVLFAQSLSSGKPPSFDPCLPEKSPYKVTSI
mmetsp:Transcript_74003/g.130723  ORF Transcript_74003/g.130723 Transcript_74003/m.130723 type:complete len:243 (-) Transcript_74003:79-807(-)